MCVLLPELHSAVWSRLSQARAAGAVQREDAGQDGGPGPHREGDRRQDAQLLLPFMRKGAAAGHYGSGEFCVM